jgi:hypothetical protein
LAARTDPLVFVLWENRLLKSGNMSRINKIAGNLVLTARTHRRYLRMRFLGCRHFFKNQRLFTKEQSNTHQLGLDLIAYLFAWWCHGRKRLPALLKDWKNRCAKTTKRCID